LKKYLTKSKSKKLIEKKKIQAMKEVKEKEVKEKEEKTNSKRKIIKKEELKAKGYMPIRKVAELAGVEKSTIHFYISQGLLPKPVMVSKQMAYYPPETVERVKIVKQLQKRFLPLKEIKKILKRPNNEIKEMLMKIDQEILITTKDGKEKTHSEIDLPQNVIEELKKIGLIKKEDEKDLFREEILSIISDMRKAGLDESHGFSAKFLKNYVDICKKLVEIEFTEFNSKVMGKLPSEKIIDMAKIAIEKTSELIKILHKKTLLEKLEELTSELNEKGQK
jgi:DNA-binding transcriptional MerR regulator